MLKLRIITALWLIPLVLLSIFYLSSKNFAYASAVVMLLAAWEWSRLAGMLKIQLRIGYMLLFAGLLFFSTIIPPMRLYVLSSASWIVALSWLVLYSKRGLLPAAATKLRGFAGIVMLIPCWTAINFLCFVSPRPWYLLALFLIVWVADTAGYFVGSRWGKHKLAPKISPAKTLEGAGGALISVSMMTFLLAYLLHYNIKKTLLFLLLVILTTMTSVIGDLFESLLKRQQGLKDSSGLLPGHGGILDRIDSLTAAAPLFALGIISLGLV